MFPPDLKPLERQSETVCVPSPTNAVTDAQQDTAQIRQRMQYKFANGCSTYALPFAGYIPASTDQPECRPLCSQRDSTSFRRSCRFAAVQLRFSAKRCGGLQRSALDAAPVPPICVLRNHWFGQTGGYGCLTAVRSFFFSF